MYQNWMEEMDQIGTCCNNAGCCHHIDKPEVMMITANTSTANRRRIRIRRHKEARASNWSLDYYYTSSTMLLLFWLILSVGSSMAVMAYQNDLSAISSSSNSNSATTSLSRHGCVWSRTDGSGSSNSNSNSDSINGQQAISPRQGLYAPGNDPFQNQQQQHHQSQNNVRTFPYSTTSLLSSSSSSFPVSTSGGSGGVLTLACSIRTLNADFQNYTLPLFTREQVEQARMARVECSDKLLFESSLSANQSLFQLRNLQEVQIDKCKIRKVPKAIFSGLSQLRRLTIRTENVQWSPSVGLEIESGAFQGLGQLESLDLSHNNIWTLFPDPNVLCYMRNLVKLNVSGNRLTDIDEFGLDSGGNTNGNNNGANILAGDVSPYNSNNNKDSNYYCALSVQNVDLSFNSLRRVGKSGFSRLRRLVELRLQHNLLEELEDSAFNGLSHLKLLNLSSNRLVALPPSIFTGSPGNMRELYLQNNSISALSPQLFAGLDQLLLLDLSQNSLTSQWVRETIFSTLIRLVVLKLSFNKLTTIDSTVFSDLTSLQSLHLNNNELEVIQPNAFLSLKNLHSLDLSNNRLKFVDVKLLSNLWVLRQLYFDHNQLTQMDPDSLRNCTYIEDLGIADNLLQEVPLALRGLGKLKTLDIGENRISSVSNESFSGLGQLYGLRIVDNRVTSLPAEFCESMKNLRVLNVAQNRINQISSRAFPSCPHLRALRLDSNFLEVIPTTLAPQLPNLLWLNVSENRLKWADYRLLPPTVEWLDLSHNQLESLMKPDNVVIPPPQQQSKNGRRNGGNNNNTLPTAFSLRVLDASYNKLKSLDHTHIPVLLDTLRLNHNQLRNVAPNTFSLATRLRRVELIGNEIENLPLDAIRFPPIPPGPLPEMYLGDNPFLCDCSMEWLTRISQLSVLRQHPRIVDLDAIVCRPTFPRSTSSSSSSSSSLSGKTSSNEVIPLVEARSKDFLCPYTTHCFALCQCCDFDFCDCKMTCPGNCTCYHDTAWSSNIVECSNLAYTEIPGRIPMDATEIFLDGNQMTELASHVFIGKKNLRSLYLNGSQIETIKNKTFNGLKSLEILRLENNVLQEIQGFEFADLDNLRELYLQNNLLRFINHNSFNGLKFLKVLRLDGNLLVDFSVWELTKTNGYLNSVMLSGNPWTCDCEFLIPFRRWVASLKNTIVVDFALAKCQPTPEQQQELLLQQQQQQESNNNNNGHNNSSAAIMNSGEGSTMTSFSSSTTIAGDSITTPATSQLGTGARTLTHPTINSMCAPLTQISFNYNLDNPALLPPAASSSSAGGGNQGVVMNNHISSMGGAARNIGSSQLSGPYHHAHLENEHHLAGNYQQGFPQNENIIATTAAAGGGRHGKDHGAVDHDDNGASGNSTFLTCLLIFIAVILVASVAFLVGLVTSRGRRTGGGGGQFWWWRCFSKCGINGGSSSLPKCLSAPNSSATNEGGGGSGGLGGTTSSGDMDYYYYSDQEKLFDAYFIYSQKDEEFVTEKLTCELERGGPVVIHQQHQHYFPATLSQSGGNKKLRLCLHYRDLCLAPDNPWSSEMILSACDASKRVVLVISNNFLNGEWTNNHFRTSVHSAIQQSAAAGKIIVIKLPPVSDQSVSSICSVIEQHQQQRQYTQQRNNNSQSSPLAKLQQSATSFTATRLEWGDKNFWPKFRLLLPTPQIPSTGNNNRNDIATQNGNFPTISSHGTTTSQLPYTTNLNPNGINFMNAVNNGSSLLPYQIPMIPSHHHYHQPSDPVVSSQQQQQQQQHPNFITMMNWSGQQQQQHQQGIPSSIPLVHSSSVHPMPSQLTPQQFGYSNVDGFHNNLNSQQTIICPQQQHQQPVHFSSSNNIRQSLRQQPFHHHHHNNHNNQQHGPPPHQHIHSLSQLSNMSTSKSPVEANYSSSAVSSGNEEFDHVYSTLDSPLESPCSDLGPGHVAGQFEGAMISGAQVNRHQIQHSTSSGISSGSDATSGTGGCHPGPPMYFV